MDNNSGGGGGISKEMWFLLASFRESSFLSSLEAVLVLRGGRLI